MACKNFSKRPLSYKIGVGFLVTGAMLLVVGFTAPYWKEADDGSTYSGLWSECDQWTDTCKSLSADETAGWWTAVQVLESLGLFLVVLSCACTIFENTCWPDVNSPRLMQELTCMFGGIMSLIGWILFLAKTQSKDSSTSYSWAFYITVVATVFLILASVIILFGGKMAAQSKDLPHHVTSHVSRGHVSPAPARRFSHLWADSRPETPEMVATAGGTASQPLSYNVSQLPPLPPASPPPAYDNGGTSVDARTTSPSPSVNEPRMSIISMSAEQPFK